MIERSRSDCEGVEIFTHRVGSIGASRRGTVFFRGMGAKSREVTNMASSNAKTTTFQKRGAGFKAASNLYNVTNVNKSKEYL
jgi:hypothetical protein